MKLIRGTARSKGRPIPIPFVVVTISLLITVIGWAIASRLVDDREHDRFEAAASDVKDALTRELELKLSVVRSVVGYAGTKENYSQENFRQFVSREEKFRVGQDGRLSDEKAGVMGYMLHFPAERSNEIEALGRKTGISDFKIYSRSEGAELNAVLFAYPQTGRMGFDMYSQPERRKAIDRAIDDAAPSATGKIFYLVDRNRSNPAFLVFLPVYRSAEIPAVSERRRNVKGLAFVALTGAELFASINKTYGPLTSIEVYDGKVAPDNLLYQSPSLAKGVGGKYRSSEERDVYGRIWTIVFHSTPLFDHGSDDEILPWILFVGTIVSGLLGYLSFAQSKAREETEAYAREVERRESAQSLLARASAVMASSLDYQSTLANVAQLAVPRFADWCAVDMLGEDGAIVRLAVAHINPEKLAWAKEIAQKFPPDPDAPTGLPHVLRTGKPELYPVITQEMLDAANMNDEQRQLVKSLELRSVMMVPMIARKRTLGAITFVWAESNREYTDADLRLAEEIAERAALAVDNARLYASAQAELQERKLAEDRVRQLNDGLEQLVDERTLELKIANEELEAFCYSVSHDLRAPLRSVDGFSKALLEDFAGKLDDEAIDNVNRVRAASHRMDELITALLTLSRLSRAEIFPERSDLSAMAIEVAEEIDSQHRVDFKIEPGMNAKVDPRMMRAVFDNLIANSVKFSGTRSNPTVEIGQKEGVYFVKDNGVGFNPEYSSKLFQPFERLHTVREFPGSGIGLATVARIVKRHGGEIWAESKVNEGATFYFTLPD